MMNIKEIQELRDQLEKDLTISVRQHLNDFRRKTGLMPESVYVNILSLPMLGRKSENAFDRVSVRLEL